MKNLAFLFVLFTCSLVAQDTIRFRNGEFSAVKVNEIGLDEIKYNRFDNLTGPLYVVAKNEIRFIKYSNCSVDSFNITKPKIETPQIETPAYVDNTPAVSSFKRIQIVGKKKLFYDNRNLNDNALFGVIKKHPDQGIQNLMIKEFSRVSVYKQNRRVGLILLYGGMGVATFSGAFGNGGVLAAFFVGSAACVSGSIIATVNKNKRYAQRAKIAKIYNGDFKDMK